MTILSVDVGTTAMKMGVFGERRHDLELLKQFSQEYPINTYNDGLFSDIEPEKWQAAFAAGCKDMAAYMPEIDVMDRRLPSIADRDGEYYLRQEGKGLLIGAYEKDMRFWAENGTPQDFGHELFDDDLDRVPDLVSELTEAGVRLTRVEPRKPTLEDLYFEMQRSHREESTAGTAGGLYAGEAEPA